MDTIFNYKVSEMKTYPERDGFQNVVYLVVLTVTATQGTVSFSKDINFTFLYDTSENNFIPYEQLTENIVLGWIGIDSCDAVRVAKNNLVQQINDAASPQTNPLPWAGT